LIVGIQFSLHLAFWNSDIAAPARPYGTQNLFSAFAGESAARTPQIQRGAKRPLGAICIMVEEKDARAAIAPEGTCRKIARA